MRHRCALPDNHPQKKEKQKMETFIIGQSFGILATILNFISYQTNTKKSLLIIQTIATICTCLSFYFLGAATGFALNIICIIRNIAFYIIPRRSRLFYPAVAVFTLATIGCGALSWQGWISLLIIVALAANTVFLSFGNPQLLRKSILVTSTFVIIYNIFVLSIGGISSELIAIISSGIGLYRFRKSNKQEAVSND
jgi:hypothetical protein